VRIFPLVVGHESGRRKWRTAPVTESGFLEAKALRSNEERAGRKPAASDRGVIPKTMPLWHVGGHPELMGSQELVRQVGLESPPVTFSPREERVLRSAKRRTQRARATLEVWSKARDPRLRVREIVEI